MALSAMQSSFEKLRLISSYIILTFYLIYQNNNQQQYATGYY